MPDISIQTFSLGDLSTNCYFCTENSSSQTFIIDPGDDGSFLTEELSRQRLRPIAILLTHAHYDHCLALLELITAFQIPIFLHPLDRPLYDRITIQAKKYGSIDVDPAPNSVQYIKDGDKIALGQDFLSVIHTPGHTPGSVCYFHQSKQLFSGDTLFKDAIGRTDLPYSDPTQIKKTLMRLGQLPPETIVYPGHGLPTNICSEFSPIEISPQVDE